MLQLIEPEKPKNLIAIRSEPQPRPIQSDLPIPAPLKNAGSAVKHLSPSDFEAYLHCPYRFYLSKILRLRSIDDRKMELEANDFGNLIHETVDGLVDSPVANSTDAEKIQNWLLNRIDEVVLKKFGGSLPPAMIVQVEQARQRLIAFAPQQAERVASGWKILATEISIDASAKAVVTVDGIPMPLIGRIDRIDYHEVNKQLAIWDYKTGDKPKKPKQAHYSGSTGWKNLQLPVYRHLIKVARLPNLSVPPEALRNEPILGYINIPKSSSECKFEVAVFGDELLRSADQEIQQVIRRIRENEFWPPRYDNVTSWDDYSAICQNDVARRWVQINESEAQAVYNQTSDINKMHQASVEHSIAPIRRVEIDHEAGPRVPVWC